MSRWSEPKCFPVTVAACRHNTAASAYRAAVRSGSTAGQTLFPIVGEVMVEVLRQHSGQEFPQFVRLLQFAVVIQLLRGLTGLVEVRSLGLLVDDAAADLLDQKSDPREVCDRFTPGGAFAGKIFRLSQPGPA